MISACKPQGWSEPTPRRLFIQTIKVEDAAQTTEGRKLEEHAGIRHAVTDEIIGGPEEPDNGFGNR